MDGPDNGAEYDVGIIVAAAKAGQCSVYWMRAREEYTEDVESLSIHTAATGLIRNAWG